MIAVNTNLLVYAHREESPWHGAAFDCIAGLAEGRAPWVIPWPCIHEFLAIATHPRIFVPPTSVGRAIAQVDAWLESPPLVMLGEAEGYWEQLKSLLAAGKVSGPRSTTRAWRPSAGSTESASSGPPTGTSGGSPASKSATPSSADPPPSPPRS